MLVKREVEQCERRTLQKTGTNIADVKQKNATAGLSYNEVLAVLAQTSKAKSNEEITSEPLDVKAIIDRTKNN